MDTKKNIQPCSYNNPEKQPISQELKKLKKSETIKGSFAEDDFSLVSSNLTKSNNILQSNTFLSSNLVEVNTCTPINSDESYITARFKFLFKHLAHVWPPEKMDLPDGISRFTVLKSNSTRMLKGNNYCPALHKDVDFMKILNEAFFTSMFCSKNSLEQLQKKTGLSAIALKMWFKWKRKECGYVTPKQVLSVAFSTCQYITKEKMQDISRQTGIQVSFIQSWFWMSRALANLFDEEKADKEELILRRMFELHKFGITDFEVELMSHLLDIQKYHVYQIFLAWCQRFGVPNYMNEVNFGQDETNGCFISLKSHSLVNRQTKSKHCFFKSKCLQQNNKSVLKLFHKHGIKRSLSCPVNFAFDGSHCNVSKTNSTLVSSNGFEIAFCDKTQDYVSFSETADLDSHNVSSTTVNVLKSNQIDSDKQVHHQFQEFKNSPCFCHSSVCFRQKHTRVLPESSKSLANEFPSFTAETKKKCHKKKSPVAKIDPTALDEVSKKSGRVHQLQDGNPCMARAKKIKRENQPNKEKKWKHLPDSVQSPSGVYLKPNQVKSDKADVKLMRKKESSPNKEIPTLSHHPSSPLKLLKHAPIGSPPTENLTPAEELFDVLQSLDDVTG